MRSKIPLVLMAAAVLEDSRDKADYSARLGLNRNYKRERLSNPIREFLPAGNPGAGSFRG